MTQAYLIISVRYMEYSVDTIAPTSKRQLTPVISTITQPSGQYFRLDPIPWNHTHMPSSSHTLPHAITRFWTDLVLPGSNAPFIYVPGIIPVLVLVTMSTCLLTSNRILCRRYPFTILHSPTSHLPYQLVTSSCRLIPTTLCQPTPDREGPGQYGHQVRANKARSPGPGFGPWFRMTSME